MAESKLTRQLRKELADLFLRWWGGEDVSPLMKNYYQLKRNYLRSRRRDYTLQESNTYHKPLDKTEMDKIEFTRLSQLYEDIYASRMRGGCS
ncbi:MAG TPA: hypothetical protein VJH65_03540 [Candidatus Nanoarchaeia archaeon]|nr:hypothetical protein [Candidatus Pacearchaeota archaeon]HLC87319.1 hypothetical protein [Candidatus Nanoarchaeia archaeon]